jgi:hypothetical protein
MYELRSTRVQTDRVLSVPGTDFQPGPQIASIPPRLGQVPGTDFLVVLNFCSRVGVVLPTGSRVTNRVLLVV